MNTNAPLANAVPGAVRRKLARVRPNPNEGNPLLVRRGPRELCHPIEKRSPLTNTRKVSDIKAQRHSSNWAALSSTTSATPQEPKATPFNSADWNSYKLVTTKASLLKGLRYHVIRMHPKRFEQVPDPMCPGQTIGVPRKVSLLDPKEFRRPIKLHRRDPSAPLGGVKQTKEALFLASQQATVYDEDKEARQLEQAKKAVDRAEMESKIAPHGGARKKNPFARKTEQVFNHDTANAKMRYEEAQPWFIEDFDNTNTWQGQREQNMSNGAFVALVHGEDGKSLRMIPMEKWYKFREVNKFKLSFEEAVARKKKFDEQVPSWIKAKKAEKVEETEKLTAAEQALYNKNMKLCPKNVVTSRGAEDVKPDTEEVDYEEGFDNDDAGQVYGVDDEQRKEIEKRIKKEQLSANALNCRDERLYDAEKSKQMKIIKATKKHGKQTRKALRKREGNHIYNSDSDSNPYASPEGSEDEDEVVRLAEKHKKEVEAKLKAEKDKKTAEAAKEAQKQADAVEKKLKAAEKRKEAAAKKKTDNAQKVQEQSTAPVALTTLEKKKTAKLAAIPTVAPPTTTSSASRNIKRPASDYITGSNLSSDEGPIQKKLKQIANANDNARIETPNGIVASPPSMGPTVKRTNKKRKSDEIQPGEIPESKKQRTKLDIPESSPSPPLPKIITSNTPAPITDDELKALLRSYPQGVTVKFITTAFKGRIVKTKEDIQKMVTTMKKVGKPGPEKGTWILKH